MRARGPLVVSSARTQGLVSLAHLKEGPKSLLGDRGAPLTVAWLASLPSLLPQLRWVSSLLI